MPVPMYDVGVAGSGQVSGASCAGGTSDCLGLRLATVKYPTVVHDEALIKLTRKINRILDEAREKGRRKNLSLELINVGGQALLAWTSSQSLAPEARRVQSLEEVNRVLGVQPRDDERHDDSQHSTDSYA